MVDSGIVVMRLDTETNAWTVTHSTVHTILDSKLKPDTVATTAKIVSEFSRLTHHTADEHHVFIEQYRDRGTAFVQHGPMRKLEVELKQALPGAALVDNTGVKRVITREMMELLDVWKFPTTNHRDLQAAARIGLYGAVKIAHINNYLFDLMDDRLKEKE